MKIMGILTFWSVHTLSILLGEKSFANVHGFKLQPWQSCSLKKQCETIQPKEWSTEETVFLDHAIQNLKNNGLSDFINQIQENGIVSLQRSHFWFSFGLNPFAPVYKEDRGIHAIASPDGVGTIIFTDAFFNDGINFDPIPNVETAELTLLHELAHVYDHQGKFSKSPEFYEMVGFKNFTGELYAPEYTAANKGELAMFNLGRNMLNTQNRKWEALKLEREFGMSKGLPRFYSTSNPAEAFADVVAFIYFDPNVKSYLSPEMIEYIDKNVLKGSRAK